MKLLLISNMYPSEDDPYFGSFIRNIKEGLISNGISVDLITIDGQGKNLKEKLFKYFVFFYKILKTNFNKYDAIQLSYPSHTIYPFFLKPWAWKKLIVRFHGLEIVSDKDYDFFLKIRRLISKLSTYMAKLVVVPSEYFKEEIIKLNKNALIYKYPSGGIDSNRFFITNNYTNRFDSKCLKIGYVGRVDIKKGVDILLTSLRGIDFNYELTVVGKGPLLNDMKQMAREMDINAKFIGAVDNAELIKFYNEFDVFIFPTERKGESFGNVAIEAMACGVPVIGSDFAGLKEYLVDKYNGLFFTVSDPRSLRDKISYFNSLNIDERIRFSNNAKSTSDKYEKISVSYEYKMFIEKMFK
ncbi:glycosyltransferase family 4 protein [Vibrio cholerae]|uniref:glycosyltransferase family 4 protein n=1 Tax=Vibrio cholerae TaxID=666 RepID=UPI001C2F1951